MKKIEYFAYPFAFLCAIMTLSSCSNDDMLTCVAENHQGTLLQIRTTDDNTRAIKEGTDFVKGDTIGLVLATSFEYQEPAIDQASEYVECIYAVCEGGGNWKLEKDIDLSKIGRDIYIKAYYPYHHDGKEGADTGNGVKLMMKSGTTDYLTTDSATMCNESNPVALISFSHRLALLSVVISKNSAYTGEGYVTDVTIGDVSQGMTLTFVQGKATGNVYDIKQKLTQTLNRTLTSTAKADFLVIPENLTGKTVVVNMDGEAYEFCCPEVTVEPGKKYSLNVGVGKNPPTIGEINGYEWVDLALPSGLKWATCNVGAQYSTQWGTPFAWGETETKEEFSITTSATHNQTTEWLIANGYTDAATGSLTLQHDAAHAIMGGTWRMPTNAELEELIRNCEWECSEHTLGIAGYTVKGKNGNSIFLPVTGYRYNKMNMRSEYIGCYWTSTSTDATYAYMLTFDKESHAIVTNNRYYGCYIRAVSQ